MYELVSRKTFCFPSRNDLIQSMIFLLHGFINLDVFFVITGKKYPFWSEKKINKELTQSKSNLRYSLIQAQSNEFFQQMLLQNQPKFIITIICYNNTFMLPLDVQASTDTNTIKQTINKNINDLPEKLSGLKTCLNI